MVLIISIVVARGEGKVINMANSSDTCRLMQLCVCLSLCMCVSLCACVICLCVFVYTCVGVMVSLVGLRGHHTNIAASSDSGRIICNRRTVFVSVSLSLGGQTDL